MDPSEPDVQDFIERNPAFAPVASSAGSPSTSSRLYNLLISQPPLTGFDGRRPDFLWVSAHSAAWFANLIEIERPSKKIYNRSGAPSAKFGQARNQLHQWRVWFKKPENVLGFRRNYGIPEQLVVPPEMYCRMILVYGRRKEVESNPTLNQMRNILVESESETLMSFDRLTPNPLFRDAITVKVNGVGRYRAVSVPPTFVLRPGAPAHRLLIVDDIGEAIDGSPGWTSERREFVKSRIPYWRAWAEEDTHGNGGWIGGGDWE